MPSLLQAALFLHDPPRMLRRARRRYGPMFQVKVFGFPPEVFVTTAELAERVYALDAGGGRAGEIRRQALGQVVGNNSLLTLDGDPWWRHRRLLSPPLHGRAISGYQDRIAGIAAAEVARWPVGRPFALRDGMQRITLEVILRLVFGIRDTARLARLRALIPELIKVGGSPVLLLTPPRLREWAERSPVARRLPVLPTTRFLRVRAAVDDLLYAEIAERRDAGPDPEATDVLTLLLAARDEDGRAMNDQELRDELITLLEAGHETTATGLAWAFERLLRNPDALARLREELAAGEGKTYLEAVVKEALRCRPVVFDAPRLVDEPLEIGGNVIPRGTMAAPLIYLIHHDPDVYPDPEAFRPERFLGEDAARAGKSWMPFGGGRRYCVGAQLALLEMRVIIAEVLRRVELSAPDPAPETARMRHVTFVPRKGTRVQITSRTGHQEPTGLRLW
jgi:cytochrome P450